MRAPIDNRGHCCIESARVGTFQPCRALLPRAHEAECALAGEHVLTCGVSRPGAWRGRRRWLVLDPCGAAGVYVDWSAWPLYPLYTWLRGYSYNACSPFPYTFFVWVTLVGAALLVGMSVLLYRRLGRSWLLVANVVALVGVLVLAFVASRQDFVPMTYAGQMGPVRPGDPQILERDHEVATLIQVAHWVNAAAIGAVVFLLVDALVLMRVGFRVRGRLAT